MARPIKNRDGSVSPQGFACGYVDDSHGHGTRIEMRHGTYLARADGGHATLYEGAKLSDARGACRKYAKLADRYWFKPYYVESQGVGDEFVARVRMHGVIIGVGKTVAEAMTAAARHERAEIGLDS